MGDRDLRVGGLHSQRILAMLLLNANTTVTVGRLGQAAWDEEQPATLCRQVRNRISALRGTLTRVGAVIKTERGGYRLQATADELDALAFREHVSRARELSDQRQVSQTLRQALALWRGPLLGGLASRTLEQESTELTEMRIGALCHCIDLELARGEHTRLLPELCRLAAEHPLHERFAGQLMTALHRDGRQGEALDTYARLRRRLAEQLGVEPSPELAELHLALLRGEFPGDRPRAAAGPASGFPFKPRELPAGIAAFTGRDEELKELESRLGTAGQASAVVVATISGPGGVGKSALAVLAAQRVADQFPDGQLYIDLQGATVGLQPLNPLDVLGRFLRTLGCDAAHVPCDVGEAAARFRSVVAGRRFLFVLDNAHDSAQVEPLLPGTPGSAVVVTSRRGLTGLDGVYQLRLAVLSEAASCAYLTRIIGQQRAEQAPEAVLGMARSCGHLPLALRVAGARLARRPGLPVQAMADRLANARRRLDELELPDVGVRSSLEVSLQTLRSSSDPTDRAAANALVVLSLPDGPDIDGSAATSLLGLPEITAERLLDRLVDINLVEAHAPDRFRLHDLVRLYGRELAQKSCPGPRRSAALTRLMGSYIATAWRASTLIRPGDHRLVAAEVPGPATGPGFIDTRRALAWFEAERRNLLAAILQGVSAEGIPAALPIQLAQAIYGFCRLRSYWTDIVSANDAILTRAGGGSLDPGARAAAMSDLGASLGQLERYPEAVGYLRRALSLFRETGDRCGEARALSNLGVVSRRMRALDDALAYSLQSLRINEEIGQIRGQAMVLGNLAALHRQLGDFGEGIEHQRKSLALFAQIGDGYGQAIGTTELARLYERIGRPAAALECLQHSLAVFRDMGDRFGQVDALRLLGTVYFEQDRLDMALAAQREAAAICSDLGAADRREAVLAETGRTLRRLGLRGEADERVRASAQPL